MGVGRVWGGKCLTQIKPHQLLPPVMRLVVEEAPFLPYSENSRVCRSHRKNNENPALISTIISLHIRYLETGEEMAAVRGICVSETEFSEVIQIYRENLIWDQGKGVF